MYKKGNRLQRMIAAALSVTMLCSMCSTGFVAYAQEPPSGDAILEESFEIGESFTANSNTGVPSTSSSELYWNGGQPNAGSPFDLYFSGGTSVTIGLDQTQAVDGESSVFHTNNAANSRVYIQYKLYQDTNTLAKMVDGATYTASVWVKQADTSSGGRGTLQVFNTKNGNVGASQSDRTTEWEKLQVDFVYDATKQIRIEFQLGNSAAGGTTYFDMLVIEECAAEPVSVQLPESATVAVGETITLPVTVTPQGESVVWSSNAESVASVDQAGVVTGVAEGTAVIQATAGEASDTCTVTVTQAQSGTDESRIVDESFENFTANNISGQESTTNPVVWNGASPTGWSGWLNTPSVTLDANVPGAVDGAYCLRMTANATSGGRMNVQYTLTDEQYGRLEHGAEYAVKVWFKGENATFRSQIQVKYLTSGNPIVTFPVTSEWSEAEYAFVMDKTQTDSLTIVVGMAEAATGVLYIDKVTLEQVNKVSEIQLNHSDCYLETNDTLNLEYTFVPSYAVSEVVFTSSNDAVATVNANGTITGVSPGEAVITATAVEGNAKATCTVTVVDEYIALQEISLNKTSLNVNPGWTEDLTVGFVPANATETRVVWSSSDEDVASVDENGRVTTSEEGTATITASVGTLSATCAVTVSESADYPSAELDLNVGFGQKTTIDLNELIEGNTYVLHAAPSRGKIELNGSEAIYTPYTWQMERDGAFVDQTYSDQVVFAVSDETNSALITVNITIEKLEELIDWSQEMDLLFTEAQLAQIRSELNNPQSLRYQLLQDLLGEADRRMYSVPAPYVRPPEGATTSYDTDQRPTGDTTVLFLMAYLFTKDLEEYEDENALYLAKTIEWVKASLEYPFWGTLGYQNNDLAGGHQLFSVAMVYHWLKEELADVTCTHCMGTDGTDWSTVVTEENVPILEAMEKRLWQAGTDMYTRNFNYSVYVMNHMHIRMGGLLAAAIALQEDAETDAEKQTLVNWMGMVLYKDGYGMNALMPDGTSQEGLPYWEYGTIWVMKGALMARTALGIDLFDMTDVYSNSADYVLYNALPVNEWIGTSNILNVGDSPTYHYNGPSDILRVIAAEYDDPVAQWLASVYEAKKTGGSDNLWMSVLFADPSVPSVEPSNLETLKWFKDMDHVIARSDWSGNEDVLSVKCGVPLGKNLMRMIQQGEYVGDPDAGHAHPDANHVTLYSNGEYLLRDDGYADKFTSNHNTLLVNGTGQMGEGGDWMEEAAYISNNAVPNIRVAESNSSEGYDYIVGDAAEAYASDLGLDVFDRNIVYLKEEKVLLIVDNIQSTGQSNFELRWFPKSKSAALSGGVYMINSAANTLNFFAFTDNADTVFEDVTVYGETVTSTEKAFRQTYTGSSWQNAVAFSWNKTGSEAAFVKYRSGNSANEHQFCVNGKIYTINVGTNEVTVTQGDFETEGGGAADDSTISTVLLNGTVYDAFDPETENYTLDRWWKTSDLEIEAYAAAFGATVEIEFDNVYPGEIEIRCTSRDGTSVTEYVISVTNETNILGIGDAVSNVSHAGADLASTYDSIVRVANDKPNWTVPAPESGKVLVTYDLTEIVELSKIDLAMHNSKIRDNYYDINISSDGNSWTPLITDGVFAATADISENNHAYRTIYDGPVVQTRYVQVVLRGNSVSGKDVPAYNGIQEITFFGESIQEETGSTVSVENYAAATVLTPEEGWTTGENEFSVSCAAPCAVIINDGDAGLYTRLNAIPSGETELYRFTAQDVSENAKVIVLVKGDANMDGKLSVADRLLLNRALLEPDHPAYAPLDTLASFACDMNGDGAVTVADRLAMNRALQDSDDPAYAAPSWDEQ